MTRELEGRLLASVPTVGHFEELSLAGIGEHSFSFYGPMYRYIQNVVSESGHLPRLHDLRQTFNLENVITREPKEYDWLLKEFVKLTTVQRLQEVVEHNITRFGEEPVDLISALVRDLTQLMLPAQHSASLTDTEAPKRFTSYADRVPKGGNMIGVPTGLSYFDVQYRLGWLPGELNGIVGRLFMGKSWMLIYHAVVAWQSGSRILFLSPEMPEEEANARFDALVCGMNGIAIDVTDIYRGFVATAEQKSMAAQVGARGDWITLDSKGRTFTLSEIPRLIKQFSPDVVCIDGLPLLGRNRRSAVWEEINEVSYGLKDVATGQNVVMLVGHQANRSAHNTARPPRLDEIALGDSFAQACDRVTVLSRPTRPENSLRLTVQKFRKGREQTGGTLYEFRPGNGIIRELPPEEQRKLEPRQQVRDLPMADDDVPMDDLAVAIP